MTEKVRLALITTDHRLSSDYANQVLHLRPEGIFLEQVPRKGLRMCYSLILMKSFKTVGIFL